MVQGGGREPNASLPMLLLTPLCPAVPFLSPPSHTSSEWVGRQVWGCGCACACWMSGGFWNQVAKRKGTEGLRGRDNIPGVVGSWLRSSTHESARVLLGHPRVHGQGAAAPGLCPQGGSGPGGISAYRVSPNERTCIPPSVCQGSFGTGICEQVGKLMGLINGLGTALLGRTSGTPWHRAGTPGPSGTWG